MKSRLLIVAVGALLWGAGAVWRLADLQVTKHEHYRQKAASQQKRDVELEPPRGTIYDAEGRELAISVRVQSAFAVPPRLEDPAEASLRLAEALGLDREQLAERLVQDRDFVWIARKLDPPEVDAVKALGLEGVHFLDESKRYYPMGELAAPVLGFVGTDHRGLAGLEAHYDSVVAGEPGRRTVVRDALAGTALYPGFSFDQARPGRDLHLTIDAAAQLEAERALDEVLESSRARRGTAVVLDAHTGAVVAMATRPAFDPNDFNAVPEKRRRNAVISDFYEPGSTFKVVTVAGVLEHGLLKVDDVLDCEMGGIRIGKTRIKDHKPFGELSVAEVLKFSSNVGAVKMGLLLGEGRLWAMIRRFGFGQRTGVDLPGESEGLLREVADWQPLTKAYVSFGQGVALTPLQLARGLSVIANGGYLVDPYVVERVGDDLSERALVARGARERVLSEKTTAALREMLRIVVAEGTGRAARLASYPLAGKTGTAQVAVSGGYSADRFIASFAGYGPAQDPSLVAVVSIDSPRGSYHGGQIAAPTFAAMIEPILLRRGVRPLRSEALPVLPPAPARARLAAILVDDSSGTGAIPDLSGRTAREVLRWSQQAAIPVRLHGHGWVQRQEPAAGLPLAEDQSLEVWFGSLSEGRLG